VRDSLSQFVPVKRRLSMNDSANPYSPPDAPVKDQADKSAFAEKIRNRIKRAAITGVISGIGTLLVGGGAIATNGGSSTALVSYVADFLIDVGLAYGIYRKSRACAVTMFVYSLIFKFFLIVLIFSKHVDRETVMGLSILFVFGSVFLYFYFFGILGTYAYRKQLKGVKA
jgi:serine/threonine-protein kinase